MEIIVILSNIRSNENVGSIFRTADAVGVSKIILAGYTPAPVDRFGRENRGLTKASLGAEKFVKWEKVENLKMAIDNLQNYSSAYVDECLASLTEASTRNFLARKYPCIQKHMLKNNFMIIGIEQDKKAVNYKSLKSKLVTRNSRLALVFGNEVDGLSKKDLKLCDIVAQVPMLGKKESLNVAVCAGVVLYSLI